MLTFLRKIRKSFIVSGSARNYALYAIGEIALIVIGILIALQINNWNETRIEKATERHLLLELSETINRNCTNLEQRIQATEKGELSSAIIINAVESHLSYSDSLDIHFQLARIPNMSLILSYSGYEALKNAGFELIQSKEIRAEIINLFEVTYLALRERMSYFKTFQPVRASYIDELFQYDEEINQADNLNIAIPLVPMNYQTLLNDKRYLAMIKSTQMQRRLISSQMKASLEESQRVLKLIKKELGEI